MRAMPVAAERGLRAEAPAGLLQHRCACGGSSGMDGECTACRKKRLQRQPAGQAAPAVAPAIVHEVLRSPGQPLDPATRALLEPRLEHDFSKVRVHVDAKAAESAQKVNALAYTVGHDIVFNSGQYSPQSSAGRSLLAHELTHVAQQGSSGKEWAGAAPTEALRLGSSQDRAEQEADLQGRAALTGGVPHQRAGSAAGVHVAATPALYRASRDSQPHPTEQDAGATTCPPAARLDEIDRSYREMIQDARDRGADVAADNLEHFLAGSGTARVLSVTWLRSFESTLDAEQTNQERFEDQLNEEANGMADGDRRTVSDHWDRMLTASVFEELYYASGTSTIRSTGSFDLTRTGDVVTISGTVHHHWFDPYDWHAGLSAFIPGTGTVSDADALALENCRGAQSFDMQADWNQTMTGTITVGTFYNDKEFTWTGP